MLDMQEQLDILKGCMGKKDLVPILKHLKIKNGWGFSTNSRMSIATRVPRTLDLDMIVPADKFISAMLRCDNPKLNVTDKGRFTVSEKGYRAVMPLLQDTPFPAQLVDGQAVPNFDGLLEALKQVAPFMGDDASRPWSCGVLIRDNIMYASNNVLACRLPFAWDAPAISIPEFCVNELLRLKLTPTAIKQGDTSIAFVLDNRVHLNSILMPVEAWPNMHNLFSTFVYDQLPLTPDGLIAGILDIKPFCPDPAFPLIRFTDTGIHTDSGEQEATVEIAGLSRSAWRAEILLQLLQNTAQHDFRIDFSHWPKPCPWEDGNGLQGLIVGVRE